MRGWAFLNDDPKKCLCQGRGEYEAISEMAPPMRHVLKMETLMCPRHSVDRGLTEHDYEMLAEAGIGR